MRCSMSHKNKNFVLFQMGKLHCHSLYHLPVILLACKKGISKRNGMKIFSVGKSLLLHNIVFDSIDHMSWLYENVCDAVCPHSLHRLFYGINMYVISLVYFIDDHFACPRSVKRILWKSSLHIFFDSVNGNLSRIVMACSKAHCQDCLLCGI